MANKPYIKGEDALPYIHHSPNRRNRRANLRKIRYKEYKHESVDKVLSQVSDLISNQELNFQHHSKKNFNVKKSKGMNPILKILTASAIVFSLGILFNLATKLIKAPQTTLIVVGILMLLILFSIVVYFLKMFLSILFDRIKRS